jgi:hypothetical protein
VIMAMKKRRRRRKKKLEKENLLSANLSEL